MVIQSLGISICNGKHKISRQIFRFVAAQLEQTFDTIEELLMDKTNQFSVFAGQVSAPELVRL